MIGGRPNALFGLIPPTFAPMEDIAGGGPATAPATPFQWGAGGNRLTPEDIAFQRRLAAQNAAAGMDTSPVGHWTQGLARVAQSVAGLLQNRRLDKAADQNALDTQAAIGGLNGGSSGPSIASILANPYIDDGVKDAAKLQWQASQKRGAQPHYWETNNGSLAKIDENGQPVVVYNDPTPKMNFIPDGMGGGQWVAVPTNMGGGGPASTGMPSAGGPAIGTVEDGYRFKGGNPADQSSWEPVGGAPSQGGATFR